LARSERLIGKRSFTYYSEQRFVSFR
jgi:hypothetical protein